MNKHLALIGSWLVLIICAAFVGCEPNNQNDVACVEADCIASCSSAGLGGGRCDNDKCVCDEASKDPYDWGELPGTDTDTDTDTDIDIDSDVDIDIDIDIDTDTDTD